MNPRSQTESNLSSLSPYLLSETSDGFAFTTEYGIVYKAAFRDDADYFPDHPSIRPILSFAIAPAEGKPGPKDPRIEVTVAHIFQLAFEANPNTVISYTCSTANRQGLYRSILFRRWFDKHESGYLKVDYDNPRIDEYAAVIYQAKHPQRVKIKRIFEHTFHSK
jgi:hypothetical protein